MYERDYKAMNEQINRKLNENAFISRFGNFVYWFVHNTIIPPILIISIIIIGFIVAPFYIIGNYFYRHYCRANGL